MEQTLILSKFIFWSSIFAIFYSYLGYPIVLCLIALFKRNKPTNLYPVKCFDLFNWGNAPNNPPVSLLISAYNEERIIKEKLKNTLSLDYPRDKLEIIVISDASEDKTDEYVKQCSADGVRLLRQEIRQGKTAALNMAVPQTRGKIIVFSDANSMYDRSVIKNLVKNFKIPAIVFVTGRTKYIPNQGSSATESTSLYNKLERITKRLESKIGSCIGADGAIFAIRKELYKPLKPYDINDFVIPLNIVGQGYRGVLDDEAFCMEETPRDTEGEFNRQVRITNRTIRAIANNKALLNPLKFPLFSFELISHKLLKFMLPFFVITVFITNCLIVTTGFLYYLILVLQVFFSLYWPIGATSTKRHRRSTGSPPWPIPSASLALPCLWAGSNILPVKLIQPGLRKEHNTTPN